MQSLMNISVKELQNITPSDEEFALICNFGGSIEKLTTFPPEFEEQYENDADDFMAVIADIHTDPNNNECLEVGVGHPLNIFVIAPVDGVITLTKGGIFSYHEFKQSLNNGRLTDEEWQELQSSENAEDMPEWTSSFLAGESSAKIETRHYPPNVGQVTSVEEDTPVVFDLLQNYPNPFNPSTIINYSLAEEGTVKLVVYNLSGQVIDVLVDSRQESGIHMIEWSPKGVASGIYFVRILHNEKTATIKVLFMK